MTTPIRVLLVEDNEADAYLTRDTLETGPLRVEIDVVSDGVEAKAYLLQEAPFENAPVPDLVMLDLNLPRMDGRQVLEQMRRYPRLSVIPVVILTSSDAESDIVASYELGANCYVTKPVGLESFRTIVRAVESFWLTVAKLP